MEDTKHWFMRVDRRACSPILLLIKRVSAGSFKRWRPAVLAGAIDRNVTRSREQIKNPVRRRDAALLPRRNGHRYCREIERPLKTRRPPSKLDVRLAHEAEVGVVALEVCLLPLSSPSDTVETTVLIALSPVDA
jgi:hypothetical protein